MNDVSDRKRVVRDDDHFFKRNPDRPHRVRRASPVEIREKRINGGLPTLPQGWGWFLALCNIAEGRRVALFVPNLEDATTDVDEDVAHCPFDYAAATCPDLSGVAGASRMTGAMVTDMEDANATRH